MLAALAAAGCSGGESEDAAGGASDAEIAATTCEALREINNEVVDVVNTSVAGIAALPSDTRLVPVRAGVEDLRTELLDWDRRIDELDLPDTSETGLLATQLHDGVDDALAELDDQAAEFAAMDPTVPDDEVQGVVGTWFNAVEKIVSSLEPEIFRFERREFQQAFLDEPACRNVIQQFVVD
jgi:hypothetical protein